MPAVAALAAAVVLALTGTGKLAGKAQAPAALMAVLGRRERVSGLLRLLGFVELVVAVGLVVWPAPAPGVAAGVLGMGFLAYLGYARRVAPESSCGCTAGGAPVGWRSYARAGWVVLAGGLAAVVTAPWWRALAEHPVLVPCGVVAALGLAIASSAELDGWWLLPMRQLWSWLHGRPAGATEATVPVAASVELVESSLAWQAAAHLVRSSLVEHWLADGWRVLQYTGVHGGTGARPVSVLFAVDALADAGAAGEPIVRVAVVDLATQEVLDIDDIAEPVGSRRLSASRS